MNRLLIGAMTLALGGIPAMAQSLDDLNIQIHGYATQGFLYTTQNNIFTTESSNGSPAWTEAVVNVGAQPTPKLRVGVQARYFLLGNLGNAITLDWAQRRLQGQRQVRRALWQGQDALRPVKRNTRYRSGVYVVASSAKHLSPRKPQFPPGPLWRSGLRNAQTR